MHAERENLITCAEPVCVQPATHEVVYLGVTLEFCERHAERRYELRAREALEV